MLDSARFLIMVMLGSNYSSPGLQDSLSCCSKPFSLKLSSLNMVLSCLYTYLFRCYIGEFPEVSIFSSWIGWPEWYIISSSLIEVASFSFPRLNNLSSLKRFPLLLTTIFCPSSTFSSTSPFWFCASVLAARAVKSAFKSIALPRELKSGVWVSSLCYCSGYSRTLCERFDSSSIRCKLVCSTGKLFWFIANAKIFFTILFQS